MARKRKRAWRRPGVWLAWLKVAELAVKVLTDIIRSFKELIVVLLALLLLWPAVQAWHAHRFPPSIPQFPTNLR